MDINREFIDAVRSRRLKFIRNDGSQTTLPSLMRDVVMLRIIKEEILRLIKFLRFEKAKEKIDRGYKVGDSKLYVQSGLGHPSSEVIL